MKIFQKLGFVLMFVGISTSVALANDKTQEDTVRALVAALEANNQLEVSDETRDQLYDLYADDIIMTHTAFDFVIDSKATLRSQSEHFAGFNRDVTLTIEDIMMGDKIAIVKIHRIGEQKDMDGNWSAGEKSSIMAIRFNEYGLIERIWNF